MKIKFINKAKSFILTKTSRAVLTCKKHSPAILLGAGCVAVVGGTVLACKETLKLEGILAEGREMIETIDNATKNHPEIIDKYTDEDKAHDKFVVYSQTTVKVIKNYIPAISTIALGFVCILASYKIMKKRNVALTAAYNALKVSYDNYRKRVKEKYGEDEDHNLFFGIEEAEKNLDNLTNIEKEELKNNSEDAPWYSEYSKFFDESSPKWDKNPEYNKAFLAHQQSIFNEKLNRKGHVFLNEVYDALGIPRTQAGAIVGWIKDGDGDGFVDFGMYNINNSATRRAHNLYEDVWLLDFNVDGVVYDKIGSKF